MAKKGEQTNLAKLVDNLIKDVGDDREMLREFAQELIANYTGDQAVGIAEYVAKLADALTRQNQVKAAAIKALAKQLDDDTEDDLNDLHGEIGMPFEDEVGEDSN